MQPSTAANKILKRFSATNPDFRPTTRVAAGCTVPPQWAAAKAANAAKAFISIYFN